MTYTTRGRRRPIAPPVVGDAGALAPIVCEYPNAAAFWTTINATPNNSYSKTRREAHDVAFKDYKARGSDFYGRCASVTEAQEWSTSGHAPAIVNAAIGATQSVLSNVLRPRLVKSVAGGHCSVPLMLAGEPECMRRIVRERREVRTVRVRVNLSVACHVDGKALEHWGRCAASAIDAIARQGDRVELWVASADAVPGTMLEYDKRKPVLTTSVRVKRAEDALDWQSVAFWLTSAASLRVAFFSHMDSPACPEAHRIALGSSYGYPATPKAALSVGPCVDVSAPNDTQKCYAATPESILQTLTGGTKP